MDVMKTFDNKVSTLNACKCIFLHWVSMTALLINDVSSVALLMDDVVGSVGQVHHYIHIQLN